MTHGSLFSGIGGFELGAKRAGIKTLWNCEIEEFNRKILKQHFPESKQYGDIRELENPEYVDIISGGFPCQDISRANKFAVGIKGERSGLWTEMFRICGEVRPKYIIIENSPALIVRGLEYVLCDLSQIGYYAEWQCLSGYLFGLNHKRERLYLIAYPGEIRRFNNRGGIWKRVHQKGLITRWEQPLNIPMHVKRIDWKSDFESLRINDDFPGELDPNEIAAYGNAVMPAVTQYLFESIKEFDRQYKQAI